MLTSLKPSLGPTNFNNNYNREIFGVVVSRGPQISKLRNPVVMGNNTALRVMRVFVLGVGLLAGPIVWVYELTQMIERCPPYT